MSRPCSHCAGGWCYADPAVPCPECNGTGHRHIRAGHVVAGDQVMLPGRDGGLGSRFGITVTRATQGYRDQDRGRPDEKRQRRRLEGEPIPGTGHAPERQRAWLRPFGERLLVIALTTDDPREDPR